MTCLSWRWCRAAIQVRICAAMSGVVQARRGLAIACRGECGRRWRVVLAADGGGSVSGRHGRSQGSTGPWAAIPVRMAKCWAIPCGPVLLAGSLRSVPAGPACGRLQSSYRNVNGNGKATARARARARARAWHRSSGAAAVPHKAGVIAQRRAQRSEGMPGPHQWGTAGRSAATVVAIAPRQLPRSPSTATAHGKGMATPQRCCSAATQAWCDRAALGATLRWRARAGPHGKAWRARCAGAGIIKATSTATATPTQSEVRVARLSRDMPANGAVMPLEPPLRYEAGRLAPLDNGTVRQRGPRAHRANPPTSPPDWARGACGGINSATGKQQVARRAPLPGKPPTPRSP